MPFLRYSALFALLVSSLFVLNGCFGNRQATLESDNTDVTALEPLQSEPAAPEPEPAQPVAPTTGDTVPGPVLEPPQQVIPPPEPPKVVKVTASEVTVPEKPAPVVEEEQPQTESNPGVSNVSPVNTQSPVKQGSPVRTQPPVQQNSPVQQAPPLGFRVLSRVVAPLAITLLAEETPTDIPIPALTVPPTGDSEDAVPDSMEIVPVGEKRLRFSFRGAPWRDVINWFTEQAELSLQADNVPSGTLNLTDNKYYTPTEALDILNSYLLFKEYTIIRKGKSLFVIFLPDGIPPNLLEPITPDELDERGKYEICRCVFTLIRTTPDIIQNEVEKLLGPQGSLVTLPKSQQLVITETAGTLRTIREIVKRIDDPSGDSGSIQIIEMQNVSADEALDIMRRLLAIDASDQSLRTAVDATGTKIWMTGRSDMIERAKETIKSIDDSFQSKTGALEGQPQFEIYDSGIADPTMVLAVLQTLLAGTPDVRLSLDTKTNGIAVLGRPANHATVKETIRQMQLNGLTVDVIPLKRLSPTSAVDSIKKFFATTTIDSSSTTKPTGMVPPTIEPDIAARQIIVRGTISQIAEVRAFLLKLGEDGIGGGRVVGSETIRSIPLSAAATAVVIDQIKEIWPKLQGNELKVGPPSGLVPLRSTNELKPSATPTLPTKSPTQEIDMLIDETFDKTPGPSTLLFSNPVRYLPVQYPVYQPIQAEQPPVSIAPPAREDIDQNDEIAELKQQIAELKQMLELQQATKTQPVEPQSVPVSQLPESKKNAPVVLATGPAGLMISSEDTEALDKLEELIRMLSDETVLGKTTLAVYYLKYSTAEVVAQTLQTLMGSSSKASTYSVSGTGSVDVSTAFEGESKAALLGLLTFGNSVESTGPVNITAEPRLNALMVQANPVDHKTIEKLLPILDQEEIPGGDPMNKARPRLIPLRNIRAEEAQTVVEKVYAARIQGGSSSSSSSGSGGSGSGRGSRGGGTPGQGQTPQSPTIMTGMPPMVPGMMPGGPGGFMQAIMSQMGRSGSSSRTGTLKEAEPTMTLGVDSRSNSLIVSAPETLFLEVEQFVKDIDAAAIQIETDVQVVTLKNISPDLAQQTLKNALGDTISVTTSRSTQSGSNSFGNRGFGSSGFGSSGFGSSGFSGFGTRGTGGLGGSGFSGSPFNMMRGGTSPFGSGTSPFGGGSRLGGFGGGRIGN